MKKVRLFLENFIIYGVGGIVSKIIPLIMVPIVTRMMPSSEYFGISDMAATIVSLASALAVFGMYDAMYRMFFEKEDIEYKKDICSTAAIFTFAMSVIIAVFLVLFKDIIAERFFDNRKYAYLVYVVAMTTLVSATNQIISAPTRMQNKRKIFLITNIIAPLLSYSISIPLLLNGYYVIALSLAGGISGLILEIAFIVLNHEWFRFSRFDRKLLKPLLVIAIPLLPNFIVYWLFKSVDKLMITGMLGVGAAGIYSVGSKLGHASQLIRTAFGGGWQFFSFSTMNEENQEKSNSLVFEYLGVISFICSMFVFALAKPIYQLLFENEYIAGYIVAPYLFLAPLLQMLFQVVANQFLVIKKTWPNPFILTVGVFVNILLNRLLIPIMGIEGAAIATLMGYVISDIICVIVLYKMKLFVCSGRFLITTFLMIIYIVFWRLIIKEQIIVSITVAFLFSVLFLYLYRKDIAIFLKGIRNR